MLGVQTRLAAALSVPITLGATVTVHLNGHWPGCSLPKAAVGSFHGIADNHCA